MPGSDLSLGCAGLPCAGFLESLQNQIQSMQDDTNQILVASANMKGHLETVTSQVGETKTKVDAIYTLLYMGNGKPSLKAQVETHEAALQEIKSQGQERARAHLSLRHGLYIALISILASGLFTWVLAR